MNISPNNEAHAALQSRVVEYLQQQSFWAVPFGYHDVLSEYRELADTLGRRNTPFALSLRMQADLLAVHKVLPVEFFCEIKTDLRDMNFSVEALPLLLHRRHARHGLRCLYCCEMVTAGIEFAFWAEDDWMPPISRVILPTKWKGEIAQYYERQLRQAFQGKTIERLNVQGTGDPFVIISRQWAEAVSQAGVFGWRSMIDAELQRYDTTMDAEDRYAMMARCVNRIAIVGDDDPRDFTDGNQGRWDFGL